MKTIIHVNRQVIDANRKTGRTDPPLIARTYKGSRRAKHIVILDAAGNVVAEVVYQPDHALPCGAKVWIETELRVETF